MKKLYILSILAIIIATIFTISTTKKKASIIEEMPPETHEMRESSTDEAADYKANLLNRINPDSESYDPYDLARICVYLDNNGGDILEDEKAENVGVLIEAAHTHFIEEPKYAHKCYEKVKSTMDHATITLRQYSSAQEPQ